MDSPSTSSRFQLIAVVLLVLITLAGIFYVFRDSIHQELLTLKLVPIPQKFTELYLTNYTALPTQLTPGEVIPLSFTIHNVEGHETTYSYVIYTVSDTGVTTTLAVDSVTVPADALQTVTSPYTVTASSSSEFFIELPDQQQDLHFKLPRTQ